MPPLSSFHRKFVLAAPHYVFKEAGYEITLAPPQGGQPALDAKSNKPDLQTDATHRFEADAEATKALASTLKLADFNPTTLTRSSIRAAMARCGIWPRTGIPPI